MGIVPEASLFDQVVEILLIVLNGLVIVETRHPWIAKLTVCLIVKIANTINMVFHVVVVVISYLTKRSCFDLFFSFSGNLSSNLSSFCLHYTHVDSIV